MVPVQASAGLSEQSKSTSLAQAAVTARSIAAVQAKASFFRCTVILTSPWELFCSCGGHQSDIHTEVTNPKVRRHSRKQLGFQTGVSGDVLKQRALNLYLVVTP